MCLYPVLMMRQLHRVILLWTHLQGWTFHRRWRNRPVYQSICASTVAFRPGSHISETTSTPSVDVYTWNNSNTQHYSSDIHLKLYNPIDLTGHILSPFFVREFVYQGSQFHSIAHLICYRYAVLQGQKTFASGIRKWVKHLTDFPTPRFKTPDWQV